MHKSSVRFGKKFLIRSFPNVNTQDFLFQHVMVSLTVINLVLKFIVLALFNGGSR